MAEEQIQRSKYTAIIGLTMVLMASFLSSCGGGGNPGTYVQNRARFSFKRWMRYEMGSSKTFSYGESQIKKDYKVIGYEPSWLIYDSLYLNYPYELLSDLVIGEYDVNPENGFARGDSSHIAYKKKDIVQLASAINSELNILLAVTDYGDFGYRRKFFSENSKKNLLNSLDQALADISLYMGNEEGREHVGLLFDFPSVPWQLRREYLEFLQRAKKNLNDETQNKSCLMYVVLPYKDPYQVFMRDSSYTQALREVADVFILRSHLFDSDYGKGHHGPMIPLVPQPNARDRKLTLDSSLTYYTKEAKIPAKEIVVELPYYGRVYTTDSTMSSSRPLVPLAELMNTVDSKRESDTASFCFYKMIDTVRYYYDDTLSFDLKYKYLQKQGVRGVSLYGLGYGHGMDDTEMQDGLWELIAVHFAEPAPRLFFPGVAFLLIFIGSGIVLSIILHWQVRFGLREQRSRFWFYLSFLVLLCLTVWLCVMPVDKVPVFWKIVALIILLIYPLGRAALKFAKKPKM